MNVLQLFKPVTSIVIDFENCICGGKITMTHEGAFQYTLDTKDIYAMEQALNNGYKILVFSRYIQDWLPLRSAAQPIFAAEWQDRKRKLQELQEKGLALNTTLYLGGDIPDVAAMQLAGFACAAADAPYEVKAAAQYISAACGGSGVVRDVLEKVLKINHQWNG